MWGGGQSRNHPLDAPPTRDYSNRIGKNGSRNEKIPMADSNPKRNRMRILRSKALRISLIYIFQCMKSFGRLRAISHRGKTQFWGMSHGHDMQGNNPTDL